MSDNREQVFENEEFQLLLNKYERMKKGSSAVFFDVEEFEQIIDYFLDDFKFEEAAEAARLGNRQHPGSVEIKYKFIHIYLEKGQPKQALSILEEIPVWEENNPERHFLKGTALCMTGKLKDAEGQFDRGLELSGEDSFDALVNIAIAFENVRHFELAVKYLLKAHRQQPENLSVLYDLGYFYDRLHRFDESMRFYQLYLDLDPFSDNVWYNAGIVYHKLEQFKKAVEAYDYSIALNPDYASAYFNKASVWIHAGQYEDAISTYREFMEVEPDNTQALSYLGDCYEQMELYEEALDAFTRVISIDNADPEGWYGAGLIYHRLDRQQEAVTYLKKALEFDKNNLDYWLNLGYAHEDGGQIDEAIKCYRYVTRVDGNDLDGWNALSGVLMKEKRFDMALDYLREAYVNHMGDAGIKVRMAACHFRLGQEKLGLKFLVEALELDPELKADFTQYLREEDYTAELRRILENYQTENEL